VDLTDPSPPAGLAPARAAPQVSLKLGHLYSVPAKAASLVSTQTLMWSGAFVPGYFLLVGFYPLSPDSSGLCHRGLKIKLPV